MYLIGGIKYTLWTLFLSVLDFFRVLCCSAVGWPALPLRRRTVTGCSSARSAGLESLEKADDSDWRLKMMLRFQHERKAFADFVWRVRREKRFQRGKEGKLVLKMAA